jgi:hypothetical protein
MSTRTASCISSALLAITALAPAPCLAQAPSFAELVGHDFGQRITQHFEMARYLERLAQVSDRVSVTRVGESWEGRELLMAIVTAPENQRRLDQIREAAQRLADPRATTPEQAAAIVADQPVIIWYGGSIHGFELSGAEGALKLLEHLSTRDDEATLEILRNAVILIDPMLNPDGRDAFAHLNHENLGRLPNPERDDWGNDFTGWQAAKFRTGHYYFDTNRDWFAQTQRETRARAATILAWRPQLVVDMHEMGADTEFFFDPGTDPYAPHFPEHSRRWFEIFNRAYAAAFDSAGFEYMTREAYDYFYPGYTTSFGDFQGAVGMLYEQGSSRGLALARSDRSVRTLADALEQQYLAAWTAARTAVAQRATLLHEYYEAQRADVAAGRQGTRRYLIAPEGDPNLVAELANLLQRNGIEVDVLTRAARLSDVRDRGGASVGAREFPAGTYVIDAAQPRSRLIRMLLEPEVPTPEAFLREARARVDRGEGARFYDVTAWSLPLLFNVGGYSTSDARALPAERVAAPVSSAPAFPASLPRYAYLIDGRQAASLSALYQLKARGYRAAVIRKPTQIEGTRFSSGTVIVRVGQNDESVHDAVRELAEHFRLEVRGTATGLAEPGFPVLGSGDHASSVKKPEIAMLAEDPIQGTSFGWAWFTLDRQYEIPITVLRVGSLANRPLDRFNVLVIPSANPAALAARLGPEGAERIKDWVRNGGTLVTIGAATDFARSQLELIALRSWYDTDDGKKAQRLDVPGAILKVTLDEHSWLSAGYDVKELASLVDSDRIYLMPEGPPSTRQRAAGRYARAGLRLSGHVWPETLARLPDTVFAYEERVGAGRVIAFAEDPNFRAFWRGANRLFLNAVILGPSAP